MQRRAARELIVPPMQSCDKFGTQYFLSLHASNFIFSPKNSKNVPSSFHHEDKEFLINF